MASGGFFKKLRILFLLFVLVLVAGDYWLTKIRSTDWDAPLRIVVYPINGDGSAVSKEYIAELDETVFAPVETYLAEESAEYELTLKEPVTVTMGPVINELPPVPPADRHPLKVMWWSLKMRFWVFNVDEYNGPPANIRMFVLYYDPDKHERLNHSLGLEKGLIGVVNAYASKKFAGKNNIVLCHEFLHTVGASDKYHLATGEPVFPSGFVEPDKQPLYPQQLAEIMAGVIPVSEHEWIMPEKLDQTVIGYDTALEINWVQQSE
jgi:hypothetical protein